MKLTELREIRDLLWVIPWENALKMPWYWAHELEEPIPPQASAPPPGEGPPPSKPRPRAADDFEEIRKRMQELEQQKHPGFEKLEMENTQSVQKPATPVTIPIYEDFC